MLLVLITLNQPRTHTPAHPQHRFGQTEQSAYLFELQFSFSIGVSQWKKRNVRKLYPIFMLNFIKIQSGLSVHVKAIELHFFLALSLNLFCILFYFPDTWRKFQCFSLWMKRFDSFLSSECRLWTDVCMTVEFAWMHNNAK